MRLRIATLHDASSLGELHAASWRESYAGILPDEALGHHTPVGRAVMWTGILSARSAEPTIVWLAEEEEKLLGFGSCGQQRDLALREQGFDGEISAIYVLRAAQRRRIGRTLMAALFRALHARSTKAAALWVLSDNRAACGFYEHLGGTSVGEKTDSRPYGTIREVAYGWRDLRAFV